MKYFMIVLIGALVLAGCTNTWHGAGQDIENVGDKMQEQF